MSSRETDETLERILKGVEDCRTMLERFAVERGPVEASRLVWDAFLETVERRGGAVEEDPGEAFVLGSALMRERQKTDEEDREAQAGIRAAIFSGFAAGREVQSDPGVLQALETMARDLVRRRGLAPSFGTDVTIELPIQFEDVGPESDDQRTGLLGRVTLTGLPNDLETWVVSSCTIERLP